MSVSTALNQITEVKLYKLSIFFHVHFFLVLFHGWAIHTTPSTQFFTFVLLLLFNCHATHDSWEGCWVPMGHRASSHAFDSPQISYPCWAMQSNTERNLPFFVITKWLDWYVPGTSQKSQLCLLFTILQSIEISFTCSLQT